MGSLVIQMFYDDHPGPHFHAYYPGHRPLVVYIRDLRTVGSSRFPTRQRRKALQWARAREKELLAA